jgi:hypothetical protein
MSKRPTCAACGKPTPAQQCACGRPRGVEAAGEKLIAYLHRVFAHDVEAVATLDAAFAWMQSPQGGGCLHPLDALMGMAREVLAGSTLVLGHPLPFWQAIHLELRKRGACPCDLAPASTPGSPPAGLEASWSDDRP